MPTICWVLGAAGLVPFFFYGAQHDRLDAGTPRFDAAITLLAIPALSHLLVSRDQVTVRRRFIGYGSVILAFLGGVHWGAAMASASAPRASQYVFAIVPPLIAWVANAQDVRSTIPHTTLALGFTAMYLADEVLIAGRALPAYYTYIRSPLTVGVVFTTVLASMMARDLRAPH